MPAVTLSDKEDVKQEVNQWAYPWLIRLAKNGSARIEFTESSLKINGLTAPVQRGGCIGDGRLIYRDEGGRCLNPGRGALLERETVVLRWGLVLRGLLPGADVEDCEAQSRCASGGCASATPGLRRIGK